MITRLGTALSVAIVLALTGCGGSAQPQEAAPTPTPLTTPATPSAPAQTTTPPDPTTTPPIVECGVIGLAPKAQLLRVGWDLVVASRGADDHLDMIEAFTDSVDDIADDVDDLPGQDDRNSCGAVHLSRLAFEVSVVNAHAVVSGEAEDAVYESAADAGNAWLEAVGLADEVAAFTPTYEG